MNALDFPSKNDWASFLLRMSVGGMFLLHGIGKWLIVGMETVIQGFLEHGFPIWTAYFSTTAEILGGLLLLIGFYSRLACLVLMPVCIGILVYHLPNGWVFHSAGGGWEYPQLILIALLAIFLLGTGKYGIKKTLVLQAVLVCFVRKHLGIEMLP